MQRRAQFAVSTQKLSLRRSCGEQCFSPVEKPRVSSPLASNYSKIIQCLLSRHDFAHPPCQASQVSFYLACKHMAGRCQLLSRFDGLTNCGVRTCCAPAKLVQLLAP